MRYVICGSPGSGKSTWVKERAKKGDLVWDFDIVAAVIGNAGEPLQARNQKWLPKHIVGLTMALRDRFYQWLEWGAGHNDGDVYIIICDELEARSVAKRIHAEVVTLTERIHF